MNILLTMSVSTCLMSGWWYHPPPNAWIIQEKSCELRLNPVLVSALVKTESNFNTKAIAKEKKVHDYSIGLMQIRVATARQMGFSGNKNLLFKRKVNLEYGLRYLKQIAVRYHGNVKKTISAYNAGTACRFCNQTYVKRVIRNYYKLYRQ